MGEDFSRLKVINRLARWEVNDVHQFNTKRTVHFMIERSSWQVTVERYLRENTWTLDFKFFSDSSTDVYALLVARFKWFTSERDPMTSHYASERRRFKAGEVVFVLGAAFTAVDPRDFVLEVEFLHLDFPTQDPRHPRGSEQKVKAIRAEQSIKESLDRLFLEKIHTDITIKTRDGCIEAHRAILAEKSPIFNSMFTHSFKEKNSSTLEMYDVAIEPCRALVGYIYGNIQQTEFLNHRMLLLFLADKYDIPDLKQQCEDSLAEDLTLNNVLARLDCALLYQCTKLKSSCVEYLKENWWYQDESPSGLAEFMKSATEDEIAELFYVLLTRGLPKNKWAKLS